MKIILMLALLPFCYGSLCPKGEYWSIFSEICLKCTQCKPNEIIIRTCQSHKDTLCSTSAKLVNYNTLENNNNNYNSKGQHFEKGKLHFITDDSPEEILDNTLEMDTHKHHNKKHSTVKKQRINDKFLKWDEDAYDEDYDYEAKKHKKHTEHKVSSKTNHFARNKENHHYSFSDPSVDIDDDGFDDYEDNNDLDAILDKKTKKSWHSKKWKEDKLQKNKDAARLAQLEDEKKLEEWLIQSRKQFKDRKDNLLKTLKEEQLDSYENDKRIRLNYPLLNSKDRFSKSMKYDTKVNEKNKRKTNNKHNMESEVELFKELIKNEESQEMELATLMSNKKESPFHYKTVTPSHRMFLGAPSNMEAEMNGHIKDSQEVGRNIIYEKSNYRVVPIIRNDKGDEIVPIVPVPFTAAERLVWDWQAVAVVSAIASCLLFFLVIGIFILVNARQWRKDKLPYSPIVESEEMSTRVALIQPTLEASAAEGSNTNRFLQQFLSLNDDTIKDRIPSDDINKN